jgi:hypothetical protein
METEGSPLTDIDNRQGVYGWLEKLGGVSEGVGGVWFPISLSFLFSYLDIGQLYCFSFLLYTVNQVQRQ